MKKEKKHRLLVQVAIITIIIFVITLGFMIYNNYTVTKESYLESKQELIDRDLNYIRDELKSFSYIDWIIGYLEEHPDTLTRPLTEEEEALKNSQEYDEFYYRLMIDHAVDIIHSSETEQFLIARELGMIVALLFETLYEMNQSRIYMIDILDDHESIYFMDDDTALALDNSFYKRDIPGVEKTGNEQFLTRISYPASEHSAVKDILSGRYDGKNDETFYEVYHDPEDNKDYYIGYLPFDDQEGKVLGYLCLEYDWTSFRTDLINKMKSSALMGLGVLILINGLLVTYMYRKAISPVQKVTTGVRDYMKDKNSSAVSEKMSRIKTKNEIGVLAHSFSDLATEIERYTDEVQKLSNDKARIAAELDLATRIQASMLPSIFPAFPDRDEFDLYASMTPAKEVGGDFYDFFLIDDDHLGLVIADVSGKGIPAAMFMMFSKNIIANNAMLGKSPARAITDANISICANNSEEMFVTVWLGILEISTGHLVAANAGHEYPILKQGDGQFELFKDKHGMPVGGMDIAKYKEYELWLKPGDKLFVYTDGVAEATDADEKMFGTDRILETLNRNQTANPEEMLRSIKADVVAFVKDAEQFDDLTMLALEYKGKGAKNGK